MAKRWLVLLLFVIGTTLGLWLGDSDAVPSPIWAAPFGPNTGDGDIGLAQRIAPAIDLLLSNMEPKQVYLPLVDR